MGPTEPLVLYDSPVPNLYQAGRDRARVALRLHRHEHALAGRNRHVVPYDRWISDSSAAGGLHRRPAAASPVRTCQARSSGPAVILRSPARERSRTRSRSDAAVARRAQRAGPEARVHRWRSGLPGLTAVTRVRRLHLVIQPHLSAVLEADAAPRRI